MNTASGTMPAVFVGHGSPMNAIESSEWTRGWAELARSMPRPRAILAVSAQWYVPGVRGNAGERPRTIHDFGGFPPALYQVRYPAPGSAELCRRVTELIGTEPAVAADQRWGLDHGTWSLLVHMCPEADIPVVQLSVDENPTPRAHYDLAKRLRPLRDEGVLILGSGNVVHNLHTYAWGLTRDELFDWGVRFNQRIREAVPAGRVDELIDYAAAVAPCTSPAAPVPPASPIPPRAALHHGSAVLRPTPQTAGVPPPEGAGRTCTRRTREGDGGRCGREPQPCVLLFQCQLPLRPRPA